MNTAHTVPQNPRRRRLLATAGLGAVGLAAGAATLLEGAPEHPAEGGPRAAPLPHTARVAWVFSSGGPRAFVHVGVTRALAQMGLAPDLLVGASAGAWVAVLVAAGLGAPAIEQIALTLQPWQLLRPAWGTDERWVGNRLAAQVRQQLRGSALHQLPKPVVCAVQRLRDGAVLGFNHGDAGLAVQAATAIEGTIAPLSLQGERYADADLRMPLPVRLALLHGATQVLAVDASAHEDRAPPGAERWRAIDLRKRQLTAPDAALATVLLHPDSGYYAGLSREYREHCFAAGERSAWAARDALLAMHQRAAGP